MGDADLHLRIAVRPVPVVACDRDEPDSGGIKQGRDSGKAAVFRNSYLLNNHKNVVFRKVVNPTNIHLITD